MHPNANGPENAIVGPRVQGSAAYYAKRFAGHFSRIIISIYPMLEPGLGEIICLYQPLHGLKCIDVFRSPVGS